MTIFKTTIRLEGGIRIESYFVHCPNAANVEVAIEDFFSGIGSEDNTLFGKRKRDALRLADSAARNAEPIEVRNN